MQLIPVYLYPNKVEVYTNIPGTWTTERYRRVYNRNVKIFRGLDNRVDIQVRNSDEKALDVTGYTVFFNLVRYDNQSLVFTKQCTVVDSTKGRLYVTLTESELYDINNGFYKYSIHRQDTAGTKTPMYIDSQYGALATIEVVGDIKGELIPSREVVEFAEYNPQVFGESADPFFISSLIDTQYQNEVSSSTHTFALYSTSYIGSVKIEASLDESAAPKHWTTLSTVSINNTNLEYLNLVGKWKWFRVTHTPDKLSTGKFDKVVFR